VEIATSSAYITVEEAPIVAAVDGGYTRSLPADKTLALDASVSRDLNVRPGQVQSLRYQWRCTVASGSLFGTECDSGIAIFNGHTATIYGSKLSAALTYSLSVTVTSANGWDKRYDAKTVTVLPAKAGSPTVTVLAGDSGAKFNPSLSLAVAARVSCADACTMVWSVPGRPGGLPTDARLVLTPASRTATKSEFALAAGGAIGNSLAFAANAWDTGSSGGGGNKFTFRITASIE
jgi:hypothetical protein